VSNALWHVLQNSPRPHYVHQSNIADDGLIYPVLDALLEKYGTTFEPSVPLMNLSMADCGNVLRAQTRWRSHLQTTASQLVAYVEGGRLFIQRAGYADTIPLSMPAGTTERISGVEPYAGSFNGWHSPSSDASFALPPSVNYAR
jgi:hypothetical protein